VRRSRVIATVAAACLLAVAVSVGVSQAETVTPRPGRVALPSGATPAQLGPGGALAAPSVGVSTAQYDSPGAVVSAIVTVYNVPTGSVPAISATGTNGSTVTCTGQVWQNSARHTASRTCYLRLPNSAGNYTVVGTATLPHGSTVRTVSGRAGHPVVADGKPSPTPMTLETVQQIERCYNTTSDVWLTFDDSGSAAQVNSILATLKRNKVKGRFLFRGDWARKNPALFKSISAAGHLIGNHTSTHPALSRMSEANVIAQMQQGTAATGTPKLLRPPFGAGGFTTRLQKIVESQGYRLCRWTTDTYDWDNTSTSLMVERIKFGDYRSAPIRAGGVVLMHGHGEHTASGLQAIIDTIRAKKLRLEPLT
jgi:peptidoglycan/xylan/chitin deacetylase (PgdA/CDA1 family)